MLLGAYGLVYLALMSVARDSTVAHVLRAVAFIPMNAGAAVLALRASMRSDTDARIRRALRFIGLAFASVLLGNVTAFHLKFEQNGNPLEAWKKKKIVDIIAMTTIIKINIIPINYIYFN